jgi:hypothetical protein
VAYIVPDGYSRFAGDCIAVSALTGCDIPLSVVSFSKSLFHIAALTFEIEVGDPIEGTYSVVVA